MKGLTRCAVGEGNQGKKSNLQAVIEARDCTSLLAWP